MAICVYCGRYYDTHGRTTLYGGYCGEKCYNDARNSRRDLAEEARRAGAEEREKTLAAVAAENRKLLARQAELQEREREEREKERKRDPRNWRGDEWADRLVEHPEDAFQCDWSKLRGGDIVRVLIAHSRDILPKNLDWLPRLSGDDWSDLLVKRPEFADDCRWEVLSGGEISWVLIRKPNLAKKIPDALNWPRLLKGESWVKLLFNCPEFAEVCRWENLSGDELCDVLSSEPNLVKEIPNDLNWTGLLSGKAWAELLSSWPKLCCYCKWSTLTGDQLEEVLLSQPDLISIAKSVMSVVTREQRKNLLPKHPDLVAEVTSALSVLSQANWIAVLKKHTKLASYCTDFNFGVGNWAELLRDNPDLVAKCPKDTYPQFSSEQWTAVLKSCPNLACECVVPDFEGRCWIDLLTTYDEIAEKFDYSRLTSSRWTSLLEVSPDFAEKCTCWSDFDPGDWYHLLRVRPEYYMAYWKKHGDFGKVEDYYRDRYDYSYSSYRKELREFVGINAELAKLYVAYCRRRWLRRLFFGCLSAGIAYAGYLAYGHYREQIVAFVKTLTPFCLRWEACVVGVLGALLVVRGLVSIVGAMCSSGARRRHTVLRRIVLAGSALGALAVGGYMAYGRFAERIDPTLDSVLSWCKDHETLVVDIVGAILSVLWTLFLIKKIRAAHRSCKMLRQAFWLCCLLALIAYVGFVALGARLDLVGASVDTAFSWCMGHKGLMLAVAGSLAVVFVGAYMKRCGMLGDASRQASRSFDWLLLRRRWVYVLLGLFLGALGIHNFYAGRYKKGFSQLLGTLCTVLIPISVVAMWFWALSDIFTITTDGKGNRLE